MPDPASLVNVYDKGGQLRSIAATDLDAAKAQGYVEAAAPKEEGVYAGAREKGFGPMAATGLAAVSPFLSWEQGAVEGATAGIGSGLQRKIAGVIGPIVSKVAGVDMSPEDAEAYYKEIAQGGAHPWIHGGGEAAGMVTSAVAAPALRGGGVAGTVGRGLGLLGEAGEGAAAGARALTTGLASRGALGRAGAAAIEHGARGAIEMGLYEGVKELSEESLGANPELNGEKILMAAGHGAQGGALFGGLLGGGTSLVKSGVKGTSSLIDSTLSKNADALQDAANEQRWRALNPSLKHTREAARIPGGTKGVASTLDEYGVFSDPAFEAGEQAPEKLGVLGGMKKTVNDLKAAGAAGDIESLAPRIDAALEQVGTKLGEMRGGSRATVTWGAIDNAIDSVAKPLKSKALFEDVVGSLESYRKSLANQLVPDIAALQTAKGAELTAEEYAELMSRSAEAKAAPISLQDAIKQRQALDERIYIEGSPLNPTPRVKALRDIRGKFEEVIMSAFDDAAKAAGDVGARAQLEKLKLDYRRLSVARDTAELSTARGMRNRSMSPTDYIAGGIVANVGQAAGGLVAGAPGAWLGGLAGGALGAGINKYGRSRGNAIAAAALDKLAAKGKGLGAVERAVEEAPTLEGLASQAAVREAVPALEEERALVGRGEPTPPGAPPSLGEAPVAPVRAAFRDIPKATELEAAPVRGKSAPEPEMPTFGEAPKAGAADTRPFDERINDAIHEANKRGYSKRHGYEGIVPLFEIRKEFPELSKAEFNAAFDKSVRSGAVNTTVADNIDLLSAEAREGIIRTEHARPTGDSWRETIGFASANKDASSVPWQRAGSGSNAAEEHAARKLAAEDEYISKVEAHNAAEEELDRAHGESMAHWNARKAAAETSHAEAVGAAGAENQSIEASHQEAMARHEEAVRAHEAAKAQAVMTVAAQRAEYLEKAATYARAQRAIEQADKEIAKAARGIVEGPAKTSESQLETATPYRGGDTVAPRPGPAPLKQRYEAARKQLDAAQDQQSAILARVSQGNRHLPNTAAAMAMSAMRALAFVGDSVPKPSSSPSISNPIQQRASEADMSRFMTRFDVAKDHGKGVLRQFGKGRITVQQAVALKEISPGAFRQLQEETFNVITEKQAAGTPVPFTARQRIHILLGIPTDPSQDPKMAKTLQANIAMLSPDANEKKQQGSGGKPQRQVNIKTTPSNLDRLEER